MGLKPPHLASSQNNLDSVYYAQGRYAEAESLIRRLWRLEEKILAPDDLELSSILNNLAKVYRVQGELAKAEPLYRKIGGCRCAGGRRGD